MKTQSWDQADFRAATETLEGEATSLETTLRAAGKDVPARPAKGESALANFDAMSAHMAKLRAVVTLSISRTAAVQQTEPPDPARPASPAPLPQPAPVPVSQVVVVRPNPAMQVNNGSYNPDAALLKAAGVTSMDALIAKQRALSSAGDGSQD